MGRSNGLVKMDELKATPTKKVREEICTRNLNVYV